MRPSGTSSTTGAGASRHCSSRRRRPGFRRRTARRRWRRRRAAARSRWSCHHASRARRAMLRKPRARRRDPFLQHAAGAGAEPGEKERLGQRIARMRRRPQMEIRDPVLGAQIFEVEPHRRALARAPSRRRRRAAVRSRTPRSRRRRLRACRPHGPARASVRRRCRRTVWRARSSVERRAQLLERVQIVDEHAHLPAVLARELPREAPAHADVAEIVDHRAEDIAGDRRGRVGGLPEWGVAEDMMAWVADSTMEGAGRCEWRIGGTLRCAPTTAPTRRPIRGNRVRTHAECSKLAILKHSFTIARAWHRFARRAARGARLRETVPPTDSA